MTTNLSGVFWCVLQQVTSLQQQVVALSQSNAVQDKELARLRAETLSLAAKTAAAAAATPSRLSSSSSGGSGGVERRGSSSGVPAGQQDGLQQRLAAAEEHNQMLLLKVGKLQEESNTLRRQLGEVTHMLLVIVIACAFVKYSAQVP